MLHSPSPFNLSPISKLPNLECQSEFLTPSSKAFPYQPKSAKSDRSTLSKLLFARTNKKLQNQTQNDQVDQANKSPTAEFLGKLNKDIKDLHYKFQRFDENAMTIEHEYTEMKRFCQVNDILEVNDKLKTITAMTEELPIENLDPSKSYYKEYQDAIKLSQDMHTEFTRFMLTTDKTISKFLSELDKIFKNNVQRMSIHETLSFVENYANHMQADIWGALARVTRFPNMLIQLHMEVRDLLGLDDAFKEELRRKDKKILDLEDQLEVSRQEILQLKEDFAVSLEKDGQCKKDVEEEKKEIKRLIKMYGEVVKMRNEEEEAYEADSDEENELNEEEETRDESYLKRVLLNKVKVEMDGLKRGLQRDYSTDCLEISAGHWKEGTQELEDQLKELKNMRKELKKSCEKIEKTEEILENSQKEKEKEDENQENEEKEIVFLKMNHEKGVFETDEDDGGIKERPINTLK